jgi:hypothetical protein
VTSSNHFFTFSPSNDTAGGFGPPPFTDDDDAPEDDTDTDTSPPRRLCPPRIVAPTPRLAHTDAALVGIAINPPLAPPILIVASHLLPDTKSAEDVEEVDIVVVIPIIVIITVVVGPVSRIAVDDE